MSGTRGSLPRCENVPCPNPWPVHVSLKAVEAVKDLARPQFGEIANRSAGKHAELEILTGDARLRDGVSQHFFLGVECQGVGQPAFDIVDGAITSADRALPAGIHLAGIDQRVQRQDRFVEDILETEIR